MWLQQRWLAHPLLRFPARAHSRCAARRRRAPPPVERLAVLQKTRVAPLATPAKMVSGLRPMKTTGDQLKPRLIPHGHPRDGKTAPVTPSPPPPARFAHPPDPFFPSTCATTQAVATSRTPPSWPTLRNSTPPGSTSSPSAATNPPPPTRKYAAKLGIPYTLVSDPDDTFAQGSRRDRGKVHGMGKSISGPPAAAFLVDTTGPHHRRDRKGRLQESTAKNSLTLIQS